MPAWFIITARIHDREAFVTRYSPAAAGLVGSMGGRFIVRGQRREVLEGEPTDDLSDIVIEWPDRDTALRFWNSPEYAEVMKLREGCANLTVTLVEG